MRVSHLFMIALLGGILYVLLSGRGQTEESDTDTGGLPAVKAHVPRGAGIEWTEDGDLNISLRFPSKSHTPQPTLKPDADASDREQAQSNPFYRVPD